MFGLEPLSRPVAITEILLLLAFAALVGWLLGRLVRTGRVNSLRSAIAGKETELEECRRSKGTSRPSVVHTPDRNVMTGESGLQTAPVATYVTADPLLPAFSHDDTPEMIRTEPDNTVSEPPVSTFYNSTNVPRMDVIGRDVDVPDRNEPDTPAPAGNVSSYATSVPAGNVPGIDVPGTDVPGTDVPVEVPPIGAPIPEVPPSLPPMPAPTVSGQSATGNSEAAVLNRIAARASELNFDRIGRATAAEADDLKDIVGVGPFLERKLHSLGIYTFRQIANFTKEDINKVNEIIEFFPGRIERDNWVDQSKAFHKRKYGAAG